MGVKALQRVRKQRMSLFVARYRVGVPGCVLVVLNASYDCGVVGSQLLPCFQSLPGFARVEMTLGGSPFSFVIFNSDSDALAAFQVLSCSPQQLDEQYQSSCDKQLLLLLIDYLPDCIPPRPISDPLEIIKCISGLTVLHNFISEQEEHDLLHHIHIEGDGGRWQRLGKRNVQHYSFRFDYHLKSVDRSGILIDSVNGGDDLLLGTKEIGGILDPTLNYQTRHRSNLIQSTDSNLEGDLPSWTFSLLDRYSCCFHQHPRPDQLTLNHYTPGGGIAPHTDRHSSFISPILIVSLNSDIVMEFRIRNSFISQFDLLSVTENKNDANIDHLENIQPRNERDAENVTSHSDPGYTTYSVILPRRSLVVMNGVSRYGFEHVIRPRKVDVIDGLAVERGDRYSLTFRNVRDPEYPCSCPFRSLCD